MTEGMLSHLRQRIRGSKNGITIACSLADVRGGFRGLDQAYGRQARIGKAEVSAENPRRISRGPGAAGTLKAEKARRGEFRQQISVLCDIRRGVKKEQDELETSLHAEMGDESPPKIRGGFLADSNFEVGVLVMQTAVNVNADAEWDGVSQTIKEGLGEVRDEDEADQKELEQENKALAA